MKSITSARETLQRFVAEARKVSRFYLLGGPVGLLQALKLGIARRRVDRLAVYMKRENDLHREHIRTLNYEFDQALRDLQDVTQAAGAYWRALDDGSKQ